MRGDPPSASMIVGEVLEAVTEVGALAGGVFEQDARAAVRARLEDRAEPVGDQPQPVVLRARRVASPGA